MTERLATTGEAARAVGVDPSTLSRWVSAGHVKPASRTVGGHLRWNIEDLQRQVEKLTSEE